MFTLPYHSFFSFEKSYLMKWPLVFLLSFLGFGMGIATVFFVKPEAEPFLWAIIFIATALFIAKYCSEKYFLNGLAVSMLNALWLIVIHLYFFDSYTAAHLKEMEMMERLPMPDDPQLMLALCGLFSGAVSGIAFGLLAVIAAMLIKENGEVSFSKFA